MANRAYIPYTIPGPYLDKSRPPETVRVGTMSDLTGVDGRYQGCLRKFYGMKLVKDFSLTNVSFGRYAATQKGTTADFFRGFVIKHGSNTSDQQIDFKYYDTSSSTWASHTIWATGNSITSTTVVDVATDGKFLYTFVESKVPQVTYYNGAAVVTLDAGPGVFHEGTGGTKPVIPAYASEATSGGYLTGGGTYTVAYRFYHSTRGIYSALSYIATVTLTSDADEEAVLATMDLPNIDAGNFDHTDSGAGFGEIFDTVQFFRSINLDDTSAVGGVNLYLESDVSMPVEGSWDALQFTVGGMADAILATQTLYDPWMDIMISVPQGGAVGIYEGAMFAADTPSVLGGVRTRFSNPYHESMEYFTSEGRYRGSIDEGRPLRYLKAGESMYVIGYNAVTLVKKEGGIVRFWKLHNGRGASSRGAAHSVGNNIMMLTPMGFAVLDGQSGTMELLMALTRIVTEDWKSSLDTVQSCHDARMGVSFFLNTTEDEIVCVWHGTQTASMLLGADFVDCTQGVHPVAGKYTRAFLITDYGRIVTPDVEESGSGTMHDVASGTIAADTTITVPRYCTKGDDVGTWDTVSTSGDTSATNYVYSPIVFRARLWDIPVSIDGVYTSQFQRKNATSISVEVSNVSGISGNDNDHWRLGYFRNGSSSLAIEDTGLTVEENPADSIVSLNIDGTSIEPFIEQAGAGVKFELTNAEIGVTIGTSRKISD
mgnify:CR=1 FL=1